MNRKVLIFAAAAPFFVGSSRLVWASNEDVAFGARAAGMADAVTAGVGELSGLTVNPAVLGGVRRQTVELEIRRLRLIPAGATDLDGMAFGAAVPIEAGSFKGALGASWVYDQIEPFFLDRTGGLSLATRSWREIGPGVFDVGATLKAIARSGMRSGGSASKGALDLGTVYRWGEDHSVGFSILNVTRPRTTVGPIEDRAPAIFKLGYSQRVSRFSVGGDLTRREGSGLRRGSTSAGAGFEYGWATAKQGLFSARSGLGIGEAVRFWSLGGGWSTLGARVDYAVRIPISGGSQWSHSVGLSYRFGQWDPEAEYEKLLSNELSYRQDLSRALEAAEVKQWKLAEELRSLREEMGDVRRLVAEREAQTSEAEERLKSAQDSLRLKELEDRRREAEKSLEALRVERERIRLADKQALFESDWRSYQDMKIRGVSETVLVETIKKILRTYKGTGVDLGEANRELQRLNRQ